jgi:hypothetical protein
MIKELITKIAAGLAISKKLRALQKNDRVHIDNDVWKKSKKKPQIVDLWHQVSKTHSRYGGEYDRAFPFVDVDTHGIDFWCHSSSTPGMGKVVRKKLDNLGVAYSTDED